MSPLGGTTLYPITKCSLSYVSIRTGLYLIRLNVLSGRSSLLLRELYPSSESLHFTWMYPSLSTVLPYLLQDLGFTVFTQFYKGHYITTLDRKDRPRILQLLRLQEHYKQRKSKVEPQAGKKVPTHDPYKHKCQSGSEKQSVDKGLHCSIGGIHKFPYGVGQLFIRHWCLMSGVNPVIKETVLLR